MIHCRPCILAAQVQNQTINQPTVLIYIFKLLLSLLWLAVLFCQGKKLLIPTLYLYGCLGFIRPNHNILEQAGINWPALNPVQGRCFGTTWYKGILFTMSCSISLKPSLWGYLDLCLHFCRLEPGFRIWLVLLHLVLSSPVPLRPPFFHPKCPSLPPVISSSTLIIRRWIPYLHSLETAVSLEVLQNVYGDLGLHFIAHFTRSLVEAH